MDKHFPTSPFCVCLTILCVFLACGCKAADLSAVTTPVAKHGALKVVDSRMVNQHGVPPQLRGVSFSWSIWQGQKYYNTDVVDWLIEDFDVSLLRFSMAIEPAGGYLEQPATQAELIETTVDHAIRRGVYVIIDWHDHNADKNIEEAKAFFAKMAKKYAGVPNVIYEIWNEPESQTWPVIKAYSEEVIDVIREYDVDNLIIIGSSRWDQDVDITALNPIQGRHNLVYSFHFYASDPHHQEILRQKAERAMQRGLPLFVTEWGVGESNGDGVFDRNKTDQWVNWMEQHQLSWANWNLTDKDESTALLRPGSMAKGEWPLESLTESGRYIRELLKQLNGN